MTNHDEVTEIDIPETDDKRTSLPDRAGAAMALAVDGKQPIASVFVGRAALHPFVFRKRVERPLACKQLALSAFDQKR